MNASKISDLNDSIPDGWQTVRLSDIISECTLGGNYENGESESGLPLIKMGNIGRGKISLHKIERIPATLKYNTEFLLKPGDLLFNTRNTLELVGKVAVWRGELKYALFNSNLMRLKFKDKSVGSTHFMNYVFNSEAGISQLRSFATGTTSVAAIYNRDLFRFKVLLPPIKEQQKIAEILSTVDENIDVIDAQIIKTEELKKGLMQRLLTKGIGHTQYKASALGEIPEPWQVKVAKEITSVEYGISEAVSQNKDSNIGIPIITGANITLDGKLDFAKRSYIKQKLGTNFELRKGDILFNWRSESPYHVGKTAIFNLEPTHTYASFILRLRVNSSIIDNKFFNYQIQYLKGRDYFTKDISIQVNFKLNASVFREILFLVPPLEEQSRIAAILSSIDEKIHLLTERKGLISLLKRGLMQQLLTGKLRVDHLIKEGVPA